jgi:hypothetical protein
LYAWIFTHLPGPLWVRLILSTALLAGVLLLLMEVVFPWVAPYSPFGLHVTVEE